MERQQWRRGGAGEGGGSSLGIEHEVNGGLGEGSQGPFCHCIAFMSPHARSQQVPCRKRLLYTHRARCFRSTLHAHAYTTRVVTCRPEWRSSTLPSHCDPWYFQRCSKHKLRLQPIAHSAVGLYSSALKNRCAAGRQEENKNQRYLHWPHFDAFPP